MLSPKCNNSIMLLYRLREHSEREWVRKIVRARGCGGLLYVSGYEQRCCSGAGVHQVIPSMFACPKPVLDQVTQKSGIVESGL